MLIVHLSDIHFRQSDVSSNFDPNAGLRNDIVDDISQQLSLRSNNIPAAIIVSGDIAFAGKAIEYQFAREWFEQLCEACAVGYERLFLVPGNHDVDRGAARSSVVDALHSRIVHTNDNDLRSQLVSFLEDGSAGQTLYSSISAYNEFAVGLDCSFSAPANTTVQRELKFNDGTSLNIWGFNSSIFCGGVSDEKGKLLIDPGFSSMRLSPGNVNLAVCHHPTSWLRNDVDFKSHLDQHAQIHLFGHEHSNAIDLGTKCVRLSASAVHPEQNNGNYEPGYNLIDLEISHSDAKRSLNVVVHVREYQNRPNGFRPKMNGQDTEFSTAIDLPDWDPHLATQVTFPSPSEADSESVLEDPMKNFREISLKYLALPLSARYKIAEDLSLTAAEDNDQPDFERCRRMLLRAKDRGLITELSKAIDSHLSLD